MGVLPMDVFIDPRFDAAYERHPLVLVDAGARGGLKRNWAAARRHLRVLGFEPDKAEYSRLVAATPPGPNADVFFDVALHNSRGRIHLNIARDRGLSSIFDPNRAFLDTFPDADRFDIVDRRELDADTLDNLMAARGIVDVDFVKADTQGSELFVLQGAANALSTAGIGVEVEVEFTPIYRDQPLFTDVDAYLRGFGYWLFDLRPIYWKRAAGRDVGGPFGQIVWADALYLKSPAAIRTTIDRVEAESRRSKSLKAVSIALLYGYHDYALEIARTSADALSNDDRAIIERQVRAQGKQRNAVPNFPGRGTVAGALRRLWRAFRAPHEGWSISTGRFGNQD